MTTHNNKFPDHKNDNDNDNDYNDNEYYDLKLGDRISNTNSIQSNSNKCNQSTILNNNNNIHKNKHNNLQDYTESATNSNRTIDNTKLTPASMGQYYNQQTKRTTYRHSKRFKRRSPSRFFSRYNGSFGCW